MAAATFPVCLLFRAAAGMGLSASTVPCAVDSNCVDAVPPALNLSQLQFTADDGDMLYNVPVEAAEMVDWGIDRIDQRSPKLDFKAPNFARNGSGTIIYIVDTGLNCSANDLRCYSDAVDSNGHGTTMAKVARDIAPGATLYGVQALPRGGTGTIAEVLYALTKVLGHHQSAPSAPVATMLMALATKPLSPEMWLTGGGPANVLTTLEVMRESGIVPVVAAGNSNANACDVLPARSTVSITVSAMNEASDRFFYSNYGNCSTLFGPGNVILPSGVTVSGTSVASAYVVGAAAGAAGGWRASGSAWEVADMIITSATGSPIGDAQGTPEKIVYSPRKEKRESQLKRGAIGWLYVICGSLLLGSIAI